MKLVNLFSILGLMAVVTACGSSQPTTGAMGNLAYNQSGYPYPQNTGYGALLIGGVKTVDATMYGNVLQATAYVNAGDRINVNLYGATYSVTAATCGSQWYNTVTIYNPPNGAPKPLTNVTVTLNGQVVNGSATASAAGQVVLTANLDPSVFPINCSALYNNQAAVPKVYVVNLGNAVTK